jgi:ParB-like chromosome segregation protein Spo0J
MSDVPPPPDEVLDDSRIQYQAMTELSDDEYATLADDIRENGVLQPVIIDESEEQVILDGHHREAIAQHYDLPAEKQPAYVLVPGLDDTEKLTRAIKQNVIGRDTTDAVKSHAVKQYIEAVWSRTDDGDLIRTETDSKVAERLGVSRQLVTEVVNSANDGIIYHERLKARDYYEENPQASYREVARQVDASRPTVTEWLKEDFDEGDSDEPDDEQEELAASVSPKSQVDEAAETQRAAQSADTDEVREAAQEKAGEMARGETTPEEAKKEVETQEKAAEEEQKRDDIDRTNSDTNETVDYGVEAGEWWELPREKGDPHLLYCGDTSSDSFISQARSADADFAFADPPYNADAADWDSGFTWRHDYLSRVADVVAVTPGIESIKPFMRLTRMPYEWSVTGWIDNGMTRGALGFGNWIYVSLFTELDSIHRESQDIARVSVRTSESDETDHKGRKPTELVEWFLERFVDGGAVIDPFLGSGTTLLTAHKFTSARVIGGEIRPEFCNEILARYQSLTDRSPKVADT